MRTGFFSDVIISWIVLATSPSILAPKAHHLIPSPMSPTVTHFCRSNDLSSSNFMLRWPFVIVSNIFCFVTRRVYPVNVTTQQRQQDAHGSGSVLSRSLTESILSILFEGFGMTVALKCHSEREARNLSWA